MRFDALLGPVAWLCFATVCLTPFFSGAVYRSVWIPLCQLWLGLGIAVAFLRSRSGRRDLDDAGVAVSRALLPLHALFALQRSWASHRRYTWLGAGVLAALVTLASWLALCEPLVDWPLAWRRVLARLHPIIRILRPRPHHSLADGIHHGS